MLIDCVIFEMKECQEILKFWRDLLPLLIQKLQESEIFLLNRSELLPIRIQENAHILNCPPMNWHEFAVQDRYLAALCHELDIDFFLSTFNTSAGSQVPTLFIDYNVTGLEEPFSGNFTRLILLSARRCARLSSRLIAFSEIMSRTSDDASELLAFEIKRALDQKPSKDRQQQRIVEDKASRLDASSLIMSDLETFFKVSVKGGQAASIPLAKLLGFIARVLDLLHLKSPIKRLLAKLS